MNNPASLRVRISADLVDIKQGLALLRGDLAKTQKQAAQMAAPSTASWSQGLASVRKQLAGIITLYGAMRAGRAYLALADEASNLSGRLRLATKSQEEFNRAQQQTFRIAQATSSEWGSVIGLYAQLAQTTGMAQERILALTEVVSRSFAVSGASATDTSRGITQLQQAMAGGILRAEEFNTLLETNARLVQALADHFEISFGDVRRYVNEGRITTEDMTRALIRAGAQIKTEFDALPPTVGRATQQVRNAILKLVGDADSANEASSGLAASISDLARTLESPAVQQGFSSFIGGLVKIAEVSSKALAEVSNLTKFVAEEVAARIHGASLDDVVRMEDEATRIRQQLRFARENPVSGGTGDLMREVLGLPTLPELRQRLSELEQGIKAFYSRGATGASAPEAEGVAEAYEGAAARAGKAIKGSNALMRDSIARTVAELDRMYAANEIGITDYFQRRQRLQEQAIDAEIAQLSMQLAVTDGLEQRRKLEEDIVKLQRDRAALGAATEREQKQALDELAKGMDEFYIARLENEGKVAAAVRARLEEEYAEQIVRLQREGRDDEVRTIRLHIDTEAAKAQLGQFEEQMTQALARLQATEQSLSAQAQAGMIGMLEAESQIRDARTSTIQQLQELRQKAVAFMATLASDSPEAAKVLEFMRQLDGEIAVVGSSMDRFRQQLADAAIDSVTNLFMDLVEGSKSAGEALRDFVRGFALAMAQIAARALATFLVLQLLDAIYPGLGKATAAMMGAGQYHTGGIVSGSGGMRRNLPAALFGAAPRYHSGGIAGLAPDEVPAILQRGEEVLTRNDPRHRDNAAGGQGGGTIVKTPVVAIGDRAVADALAGAAGEEVILTHVRNNWGALSRG